MTTKSNKTFPKFWLGLTLLLTVIIGVWKYPGFARPDKLLPDNNDSLLVTYIIRQTQINWEERKGRYWGTFFAPYSDTLRYSDPFTISAFLGWPASVTGSPLVVLNTSLFVSLLLVSLAVFLLIQFITGSGLIALTGALLFNFSGFHWGYLAHLQVFGVWSLPLCVYLYLKYHQRPTEKLWLLLLLTLTAQASESFFLFYVDGVTLVGLFLVKPIRLSGRILFMSAVAAFTWLLLAWPYFQLTREFVEAKRSLRDAAHFAIGPDEIATKYHAVIFCLLTVLSLPTVLRQRMRPWLGILVTGLVLSLGPVLKLGSQTWKLGRFFLPLPYALFYYLVPGFTGFRTPSRWIILAALMATILVCRALTNVSNNSLRKMLAVLFVVLVIWETPTVPGIEISSEAPPVYSEVARLPEQAIILELPIKLWNMPDNQIESVRSLYSLSHQHRRFNGYSGFAPNEWIDLVDRINAYGINEDNHNQLRGLGVSHVVDQGSLIPL